MKDVVLQIWNAPGNQFGGRILRNGVEDGRVVGFTSKDDVEYQALEAGIELDRIELIDHVPPIE